MAQTSGNRDEPSMEDILSSIRKIIQSNEDKDGPGSGEQGSEHNASTSSAVSSHEVPAVEQASAVSQPQEPVKQPSVENKQTISPEIKVTASASANTEIQSERGELTVTPEHAPKAKTAPTLAGQLVSSAQEVGAKHVVAALKEELNSPKAEDVASPKETVNSVPTLLSSDSGVKVAASFAELTQKLEERSKINLEDMASDMLRPMLQDWLDDNLPSLVEKLVREEIERVARGG